MPLELIIDGYNLIRQSDSLSFVDARNLEQGRETLIERLVAYKKIRGHPITVVFDGWGGGNLSSTRTRHKGIQVVYTGKGETADEWIQRRVGGVRYGAVVTSDREIQEHAERAGLSAISSDAFERRMEAALAGDREGMAKDEEEWDEEELIEPPKKGSARQLSKKEKKRRAILEKL
ncbi:MAG: NYN domain-containing protein [Deltaproteobacteria bacterium]|nr:NYN domain-containing protein [Deltaproteobacteria bacterium]